MNLLLIVSAIAGFSSAIGHSYLSERFVLAPLFTARSGNVILESAAMRRLMRAIWHLPSFAWAQVAAVTLWLAISPQAMDASAQAMLTYFGLGIYLSAAFCNALALRRPHAGNILLSIAALTLWFGVSG